MKGSHAIASGKKQSVADKLTQQRTKRLVESAKKKLESGKDVTPSELRAIRDVEAQQQREAALGALASLPKGLFQDLIGGSSKVYIEWRKRYGFPWDERSDFVNVIEVLRWFRDQFVNPKEAPPEDDSEEKLKKIRLRNAELDLGEREERLANVDEFLRDRLGPCLDEVRTGIELIHRWPDAQNILLSQLRIGIDRLQANGSSHYVDGSQRTGKGNRSPLKKGGRKTAAKDPPDSSGVRPKVRKNAKGGPPRPGDVSG